MRSSDEDSTESDNESSEEESREAVMLTVAIVAELKTLKTGKGDFRAPEDVIIFKTLNKYFDPYMLM